MTTTKKPKRVNVQKLRRLRRQKLKAKILRQLQTLENSKRAESLADNKQDILMEKSGSFLGKITGDLSLSRKDFFAELSKWFRRSVWFLAFTAAYTVSPTLLIISVSFSVSAQPELAQRSQPCNLN